MKKRLRSTMLCVGLLVLAACSKENPPAPDAGSASSNSDTTPASASPDTTADKVTGAATQASDDIQQFVQTAQEKFKMLKANAQQFIKEHKQDSSDDSNKVKEDLKAAVRDAGKSLAELRDAGASAWKQNKPKVDSMLSQLQAKFDAARAKLGNAIAQPTTKP